MMRYKTRVLHLTDKKWFQDGAQHWEPTERTGHQWKSRLERVTLFSVPFS